MLNVQLKSAIRYLKKQNGEDYQLKLQNVNLQGLQLKAKQFTHLFS